MAEVCIAKISAGPDHRSHVYDSFLSELHANMNEAHYSESKNRSRFIKAKIQQTLLNTKKDKGRKRLTPVDLRQVYI